MLQGTFAVADGTDTQAGTHTGRIGEQGIPMGDANRKGMGEGGVATMISERNYFITMNGSRLFTAKEVCDIVRDEVKAERERVLDKAITEYDRLAMEGWKAWRFKEILESLRGEP